MATATCFTCLLLISSALLAFCRSVIQAQSRPPIMNGLSWTFYQNTCPQLETIIRRKLNQVFTWDIGQAAGLLRLHFHDCCPRRSNICTSKSNTSRSGATPAKVSTILSRFARKNLNVTDAVALSGAHTIGISTCSSFTNCLYPTQDPTMDPAFTASLIQICPELNSTGVTVLDFRSPNTFDNLYYADLFSRQGLFNSDQNLRRDARTWAMLLGTQGAIRANCSRRNSDNQHLLFVVKENLGSSSTMR
ncbi:hypothetical protein GH714_019726 [Hevea brasiliensis]|uniref:peroxidase n=1 Tax=Hevea brasiliensis TaxID=3981 RepID=A0A6A6KQ53_HEVBR|nr:hypothetical protein GH714_019726 [Hevea brasiliensis]